MVQECIKALGPQVFLIQMLDLLFDDDLLPKGLVISALGGDFLESWHLDADLLCSLVNRQAFRDIVCIP